jgi:hypothetical protein
MWAYPAWNLSTGAQPSQRPPGARERVLARMRHPSFSPDVAEALVAELSPRQVRRVWKDTTRLLESPIENDVRLSVVVLREKLLDRLGVPTDGPAPGP